MTTQSQTARKLEPGKSVSIPANSTFPVRNSSDESGSCLVDDNGLFTEGVIDPHGVARFNMSMGGEVTNTGTVALTVGPVEPRG